jgi:hypothetical protein
MGHCWLYERQSYYPASQDEGYRIDFCKGRILLSVLQYHNVGVQSTERTYEGINNEIQQLHQSVIDYW